MKHLKPSPLLWATSICILLLASCTTASTIDSNPTEGAPGTESTSEEILIDTPPATDTLVPTPTMPPAQDTDTPSTPEECDPPFEDADPLYFNLFWPDTDFCNISVDPNEIYIGILAKDAIPAIDNPVFISVAEADEWLQDDWPIMRFENEGDVRGYPLAIMIWHEIVNDVVGGRPVALTFCPLCNATIAFDRTLPDGTVLDFGTTGNLRNSDLVMYDRQTESWWQQFTGEAIVGELLGTMLEFLPSQIIGWEDFKRENREAKVLSRETGHSRRYGENPYPGYDEIDSSPWFPGLDDDDRLPAMERVAAVSIEGQAKAYPFSALQSEKVVNDRLASMPIVVFWKGGTRSTFGSSTTDVGSTGVFSRALDDQVLTFTFTSDGFEDLETGSLWNIMGEAIRGPLEGYTLAPVTSGEHFWFAWSVFLPETEIWSAGL